jgi:phosphatidylglycerol:prolipoprotein diacylglycerol transferase
VRPELAVIPQLPAGWLWPLLISVWVLTLGTLLLPYLKTRRLVFDSEAVLAPLVFGAVLCGLAVVLSRTSITLHSYGFFLILGFGLGTLSACLEAKRRGYDPNLILDLMLPMLLVTVAACRIVYVLLNREQFHSWGKMLEVWQGGLSFHGVFPGSLAVVGYFAYTRKIRFGILADLLAPSVFLGYFFGRLGCFFNGCCYGHACDLPWAMQFPTETNRAIITPLSHPTQLYSAALAVVLFLFMQRAKLSPKWTQFPGQLTLLFFGLYAVERFFIEFFRAGATARYLFGSPLTEAQWTSIFGLIAIGVFWIGLLRREAKMRAQNSRSPVESPAIESSSAPAIEA